MADHRFYDRETLDATEPTSWSDVFWTGAGWAGIAGALALIAHTLLTYPV